MARYAYIRVSTDRQSYDQQIQDIKNYGINLGELDGICEEHETSNKGYEAREFNKLFKECREGDVIYAASTDRIGRDFADMLKLMTEGRERGIEIVACQQRLSLIKDDPATKIILSVYAIMDEDEKKRIQRRTANKKAAQREQIARKGHFIIERGPNAGLPCDYVGTPKWDKMSEAQRNRTLAMQEAAAMAKTDQAISWRQSSKAVSFARRKRAEGWGVTQIAEELGKLYDDSPDIYGTPTGCKPTKGAVSKWLRESNPIAV